MPSAWYLRLLSNVPWSPRSCGQQGSCSLGSRKVTATETVLGWLLSRGHSAKSRVKHTTNFCERCFPGMEAGGCHLCTLLLLCYRLSVSSRKELVHSSGGLSLVAAAQGTPLDHMVLVASKAYLCLQSHRTILFPYSKSCCPWVSLSINLNLGADWDLPFWDTERS